MVIRVSLVRLTPPYLRNSARCKIFEIEDENEADLESHDLHYHPLTDFEFAHGSMIGITANAFLLLYSQSMKCIYICNLITREYTVLSYPEDYISNQSLRFGLGLSKISRRYKVLCINDGVRSDSHRVCTLGTGTWWRVEAGAASGFRFWGVPILCNDNLHWRVYDSRNRIWVVCGFDVETECFGVFSLPPAGVGNGKLSVLRDCLCYSNYTHSNGEIFESLCKQYISVEALQLFKDGDVLMLLDSSILVYYNNTRTLQQVNMLNDADAKKCYALIFNPSLLSLKSFVFENVISF